MAAPRNRQHVLVTTPPLVDPYRPHPKPIDVPSIKPPENGRRHGRKLIRELKQAESEVQTRRGTIQEQIQGAQPGIYVEFESAPNTELNLTSLEYQRSGIELVAVRTDTIPNQPGTSIQRATVFIPDGKTKHFLSRFEKYAEKAPKQKGERRYEDMTDRIADVRLATLRALWTDATAVYPENGEVIWWEVWLRREDGNELARLHEFGELAGIEISERRLEFDDRTVTLVHASPTQLSRSLDLLGDLAEVRRAKESAAWFVDMPGNEQAEWGAELAGRTTMPGEDAVRVCILDTGINRGHPLLENALAIADMHACDPTWGTDDDGGGQGNAGHGTNMAGLALFGDLSPILTSAEPIDLRHRLESVKILPPVGQNDEELYGALTAIATSRVEIQAPTAKRCFSMAVTATDQRDRGQPTSWSAAVDALAAGRTFDMSKQGLVYLEDAEEESSRLFILSAGNISPNALQQDYLSRSDVEVVHDPGQAWNAITVGAFTEKAMIHDAELQGYAPLAASGDLSPWSTTSVGFAQPWPIKPDVVFEGGNVAHNAGEFHDGLPDLSLLTTYFRPHERLFDLCWATSAATAQVARLAALIRVEYPDLWPETVRGLIVHSARWTQAMEQHLRGAAGKKARARLVRRYGYGTPSATRALRSANDALTLLVQGTIRPFSSGKMREMHTYDLPWPKEVLEGLGPSAVRLRVTLSYFIEPNPGRRGWQKRYRYASHGLRFDVKRPTETTDEFRKRLNQQALDEDEEKPTADGSASDWYLGEQARNRGSLHSDIWVGTAADLADRHVVGIYPVTGWWKDQPKRDRSETGARYCLIVSIETDVEDVDIWTPVAIQVGIPIVIET